MGVHSLFKAEARIFPRVNFESTQPWSTGRQRQKKSPLSTSRPVNQSTVAIYLPLATGLSPACRPFLACRLGLPWARVASQVLAGSPGGLGVLPKSHRKKDNFCRYGRNNITKQQQVPICFRYCWVDAVMRLAAALRTHVQRHWR